VKEIGGCDARHVLFKNADVSNKASRDSIYKHFVSDETLTKEEMRMESSIVRLDFYQSLDSNKYRDYVPIYVHLLHVSVIFLLKLFEGKVTAV
jgi:hypothetical protein